MAISYHRLWKQLINHGLSKTDMMHRAKISTNVLARLSKEKLVSMDSMEKIITGLDDLYEHDIQIWTCRVIFTSTCRVS